MRGNVQLLAELKHRTHVLLMQFQECSMLSRNCTSTWKQAESSMRMGIRADTSRVDAKSEV